MEKQIKVRNSEKPIKLSEETMEKINESLARSYQTGRFTADAHSAAFLKGVQDGEAQYKDSLYQQPLIPKYLKGSEVGRAIKEGQRRGVVRVLGYFTPLFLIPQSGVLLMGAYNPMVSLVLGGAALVLSTNLAKEN